jgi:hypothetical protein
MDPGCSGSRSTGHGDRDLRYPGPTATKNASWSATSTRDHSEHRLVGIVLSEMRVVI